MSGCEQGGEARPAAMGLIGTLAKTVVFAVPVSATFFDLVGTVVAVEGVSMQVRLPCKCSVFSVV